VAWPNVLLLIGKDGVPPSSLSGSVNKLRLSEPTSETFNLFALSVEFAVEWTITIKGKSEFGNAGRGASIKY
jgi:hypothetical protein